ncbi:MAG TPA: metallophosphoesterase [Candidatus Acidoferrales bacterium]|nr:metallophosphoesterase [Candidatus Acidoferrales bacterium]
MTQEVCVLTEPEEELRDKLEQRLGPVHTLLRLGMERIYEDRFNHGINFFHPDKWYSLHSLFTCALKLTGLHYLGSRNAERIRVRHNRIYHSGLPDAFEGFTILQISDLHVDMNPAAMRRVSELVSTLDYDLCVLTGDFRGKAFGPFDQALRGMTALCSQLAEPFYGVLGNHDTVRMLPGLEALGIRMLMNESDTIVRGRHRIHLAGVDDAHYYSAANLEKAASRIPRGEFAVLLSHTPEIYKQAAFAGFQLFLSGHTHGGQICLPGGIPVTLSSSKLPRRLGAGPWRYETMVGYTSAGLGASVVPVRFNCEPEITLHYLHCTESGIG